MENERPNYYAIIPANVRYDEDLRANEKIMYSEITALTYRTGECWASNNYFARLYKTTPQAISKWILNLKEKGYLDIEYEYEGEMIKRRIIRVSTNIDTGINKCLGGYQQMIKENNININNIKKDISKDISKESFKKPTLDQIKEYCAERNNNVDPERFYDFYESKGWMVGRNKMKDWKACVRTWEKKEQPKKETTPEWFNEKVEDNTTAEEWAELLNSFNH